MNNVQPGHVRVHEQLENWGRWCKDSPPGGSCSPMFRYYRPDEDELAEAKEMAVSRPVNTLEAPVVEQTVAKLPPAHRTAMRWFYVYSRVRVGVVKTELGLRSDNQLQQLLHQARTMVDNALNFKIKDGRLT